MRNGNHKFSRVLAIVPFAILFLVPALCAQVRSNDSLAAPFAQSYWLSTSEIAEAVPPAKVLPSVRDNCERPVRSSSISASSYRTPVNIEMLLPSAVKAEANGSNNDSTSGLPLNSVTFTSAYENAPSSAVDHTNDPEYFANHVPLVRGLATRVLRESKAHPHVTRVLQVIHPEF